MPKKSDKIAPDAFADVLAALGALLSPALDAIVARTVFVGTWEVGGPWRSGS